MHRGDLADPDSLVAGARSCDATAHLAFVHDFSTLEAWMANIALDRRAVEAMTSALEGTGRPFVLTSGTALLAPGRTATEDDLPPRGEAGRGATEHVVLDAADRGVRGAVIRLPPTTHGVGDRGFMPQMIASARANGFAAYVGEGTNRWSAGHRLDAARLYRLALEGAEPGAVLHAVGEEAVTLRAVAETLADGLGVEARSISPEEAGERFGWLAFFAQMDVPASSAKTRAALGWAPREVGLLADLEANYFGA